MRQEDWDRHQLERAEADDYARQMDRLALIEHVAEMMTAGKNAADIVDEVIKKLTPTDDAECPVCGICP